jgi:hypothetical protein
MKIGDEVTVRRALTKSRRGAAADRLTIVKWHESVIDETAAVYLGWTFVHNGEMINGYEDREFRSKERIKAAVVQPLKTDGRYRKRMYVPFAEVQP